MVCIEIENKILFTIKELDCCGEPPTPHDEGNLHCMLVPAINKRPKTRKLFHLKITRNRTSSASTVIFKTKLDHIFFSNLD